MSVADTRFIATEKGSSHRQPGRLAQKCLTSAQFSVLKRLVDTHGCCVTLLPVAYKPSTPELLTLASPKIEKKFDIWQRDWTHQDRVWQEGVLVTTNGLAQAKYTENLIQRHTSSSTMSRDIRPSVSPLIRPAMRTRSSDMPR